MVKGTAKRIRRTPEAARRAILRAAERRLIEDGPEGVRVQHIAADLGMTGAAIMGVIELFGISAGGKLRGRDAVSGPKPVYTENLIRVDDVMESPKLAE
jgi:hypothetical protein